MGRSMTVGAGGLAFGELAGGTSAAVLEQYKLDRLLELRAVIDSLRAERDDVLMLDVQAAVSLGFPS